MPNTHSSQPPQNRNLGVQPITDILEAKGLSHAQLVTASSTPISHKLIVRACKGRWLTPHSQQLVRDALSATTGKAYSLDELFTY